MCYIDGSEPATLPPSTDGAISINLAFQHWNQQD
jgi:hypothetical protein